MSGNEISEWSCYEISEWSGYGVSEPRGSGVSELTDSVDSEWSGYGVSEPRGSGVSELTDSVDSELKCFCGFKAKLRVSQTSKNPNRMFYNCPNFPLAQCGFFQWADVPRLTGNRHVDELNLICNRCNQLQERFNRAQRHYDDDRAEWERERAELTSQLSTIQAELKGIKKIIEMARESDLMPPIDKFSSADDDAGDVVVIHTVKVETFVK